MNRDNETNTTMSLYSRRMGHYCNIPLTCQLPPTSARHSPTVTLTAEQKSSGSRQVSACLLLPVTHFLRLRRVKRGTHKECQNLMVWGSAAEMERELVWAGGIEASAAVLSHTSLRCRIQPWCHLCLSSVSLWISQAVEGGVYFSHDGRGEDLIR